MDKACVMCETLSTRAMAAFYRHMYSYPDTKQDPFRLSVVHGSLQCWKGVGGEPTTLCHFGTLKVMGVKMERGRN